VKENFDATQFITFDVLGARDDIINEINERFSNLGFEVLHEKDIRDVKKQYFINYRRTIFIELSDVTFLGDIEIWKDNFEKPSKRIKDFAEQILWLKNKKKVTNLNLILTGFAEKGCSSDTVIKVKSDEIIKGISVMSKYYFDIWTDNLIMEII